MTAEAPPSDSSRDPQPGRPSPAARLATLAEVVLVSGLPTQFAIGAVLAAADWRPYDASGTIAMRYLVGLLLIDAVVITIIIVASLLVRGERPVQVFLGTCSRWREVGLGAVLVPGAFVGTALVLGSLRWWWPQLHNVPTNPFEALVRTPSDAVVVAAVAVISGGFKEELQRAFILHRCDQHLGGAWPGLAVYSVLFGAGHLMQGWDVALLTTLLGLAWGGVFLWRGCILAPMVSHAGFNAAQVLQFVVFGR